MTLTTDAVLKIRDMYALKVQLSHDRMPVPAYTQAQIAREMNVSETTVFRVVNRLGAYAFVGGQSVGEVKADPQADRASAAAAQASLERLQQLMSAETQVEAEPDPEAKLDPALAARAAEIAAKAKLGN
jgi:DNA-binding MurR/RpiR family transcriptional regulator